MNDLGFISLDDEDIGFSPIESYTSPEVGELESFVRGAAQGAAMGWSDEIQGGLGAAWEKIKGDNRTLPTLYQQEADLARAKEAAAVQQNPGSYMSGEVTGGVGSMFIPGMGIAKAGKAAMIGKEALRGATTGAGYTEDLMSEEGMKDVAKSAALNTLFTGGSQAVGAGMNKLANSPTVTKARDFLASKAVGIEPSDLADIPGDPADIIQWLGRHTEQIPPHKLATTSKQNLASGLEKMSKAEVTKMMNQVPAPPIGDLIGAGQTQMLSTLAKKKAKSAAEDLTSGVSMTGVGLDMLTGGTGIGGAMSGVLLKRQGPQIGTAALNTLMKTKNISPNTKSQLSRAMVMTPQQANSLMYSLGQSDPELRRALEQFQSESNYE